MPSSATLEVISIVRKGGRIVKKRIVESAGVDPRIPPPSFPDDTLSPQVDHLQPLNEQASKQETTGEPSLNNPSRSGTVSAAYITSATSTPVHLPPG